MSYLKIFSKPVVTMTSREIAELTGKKHSHVTADIKKMLRRLHCMEACMNTYTDSMNRPQKEYVLDHDDTEKLLSAYQGALRLPLAIQERAALETIEQLLGVTLQRQYRVGQYRVDGYDAANKVAYEIDEPAHKYSETQDKERQAFIADALGCKFVRIKVGH